MSLELYLNVVEVEKCIVVIRTMVTCKGLTNNGSSGNTDKHVLISKLVSSYSEGLLCHSLFSLPSAIMSKKKNTCTSIDFRVKFKDDIVPDKNMISKNMIKKIQLIAHFKILYHVQMRRYNAHQPTCVLAEVMYISHISPIPFYN